MADNFNASLVINTAASEAGIRRLDSASKDLDKTLQNLHSSLKKGQSDLDAVAASMKSLTAQNAALIRSEQDRAKATVMNAKADGQAIVNQTKRQKSANDTAIAQAKANKIQQGSLNSTTSSGSTNARRDALANERIAASQAITQARVTSEVTRTATAQQNLAAATTRAGSASEMAAARSQRLADGSRAAQSGTLALNDSLSNSRYLLYDVGQTYTVLSAALLAIPVATAAVAIAYEKDFAQVIRTNDTLGQGTGFSDLRKDLKELATEIPLTFDEFSKIATIGGQLGIGGKDIESFTETVARFGAASNVSLDQASTAFGRFQNSFDPNRLDPDFFNKIGSAVAFVGIKSAATETEIIAVSNQISAAGAQFGFTADQVVGLSGALASVRIRPELARGAFQRIMLGLGRAADSGAESFNKFGHYTGLAAEESLALFKTDPSAFFYKYIGGIKDAIASTGSVSGVLDDIGAKNVFDKQFILGLANGYNVFGDSLKNASTSFNEGTFLKTSTQGVFDTMDAKLKRISSSITNVMDTLAKGAVGDGGGLAKIADALLAITGAADRFLQAAPGFTAFVNIVLGLGSAVGILLAFKAAQAFVLAGLVGFQQVLGKGTLAAGLTAKGILQQLAVTLLMHRGLTQADAQAVVLQSTAFKAMAMSATTAKAALTGAGFASGTVTRNVAGAVGPIGRFTGGLAAAGKGALALVGGPLGALLTALTVIGLGFVQAEEKANSAGDAIARSMDKGSLVNKQAIGDELTKRTVDSFITDVGSGGTGNHGKNVRNLADEIGISFADIVSSIQQGENASKSFGVVLDTYSKNKGFKDFADLQSKSFSNLDNKKGELQFIAGVVDELGKKSAGSAKDIEAVAKAAGKAGETAANAAPNAEALTTEFDSMGTEADTAATKLGRFIDKIFGIVDASAGTQSALQALGEGLGKSTNFGPSTEGGRDNVKNFQEALRAAALEQQNLIETTGKSTQQASADYIAFVEGLVNEMASRGVDPARIKALADQAKNMFGTTLIDGPQPAIGVVSKTETVQAAALDTVNLVQNWFDSHPTPAFAISANGEPAVQKVDALVKGLMDITGSPYQVVMDALTDPASEKGREIEALLIAITTDTYVAPVDADTSVAVAKIQQFVAYARTELAHVQSAANSIGGKSIGLADGEGSMSPEQKAAFGAINSTTPKVVARKPVVIPKVSVAANPNASKFGALAGGYDKVRAEAEKAGKAGKKAGEDMADGISDATRAANDYANRLKTGLQSAFEQQYGVTKATDEYHTALNAINKKRDDELAQIDDLISKQKELNDARNEELINARKAGIEKNISVKYGEVDRAADYGMQEQKALDAAAAKQKDIQANAAQVTSLKAGIGNLEGYSQAAIDNRAALRDLETKMTDMIVAYANTGASVDQVRAYAAGLTNQFRVDVGQMGLNQTAVVNLQGSLERYIGVIDTVPLIKPTTVEADTADATKALDGILDQLDKIDDGVVVPVDANTESFEWHVADALARVQRNLLLTLEDPTGTGSSIGGRKNGDMHGGAFRGGNVGAAMRGFARGGTVPGRAPSNPNVDNLIARVDGKGQVGLRSEEFVMQQPAVKYWGSDFMNAVNNMKALPHFNGGGSLGGSSSGGGGGSMVVALDAETLAFLASLQQDIKLYADSKELASAVNKGNRQLVAEGMNQ